MVKMSETTLLTNILGVKSDNKTDEKIYLDPDNISKTIVDLSLDMDTRLEALNLHYHNFGHSNTIEIINRLSIMYQMSGTSSLKKYLAVICEKSSIDPFLKSISAKALWIFNEEDDTGYQAIKKIIPLMNKDNSIGTPYKIDFVKILMDNEKYRDEACEFFCEIISDNTLDCNYRYKCILSLDKKHEYFSKQACLLFISDEKNDVLYRILAGQNLLQNNKKKKDKITSNQVEKILLNFAEDSKVEYNLRADATDVLLQLGSVDAKKRAEKIIMNLGQVNGKVLTLYDNAQNVHTSDISENVEKALTFLHTFKILTVKNKEITVDYVEKKILKILRKEKVKKVKKSKREEKVKITMNRILLDRALYSKYNCNLSHVLLKIWTYIHKNKHEEEMTKRLLEELEDMAGTCSSGYITRLVNTISGFGDFSMTISWREQLISNLTGRLNARARNISDKDEQALVLSEMTLDTSEYAKRKNFLKFLRKNLLSIREELYSEFKEYIDDADFDLYFRFAVSKYETGSFV